MPKKDREDAKLTNATARVQHMERSRVSCSVSCGAFEEECTTISSGSNFQTKFVKPIWCQMLARTDCDIVTGRASRSSSYDEQFS